MEQIIRPMGFYVSSVTYKGIKYVAGAMKVPPDEIAEQVLADWLKANHPGVVDYMRKRFDEDKTFRENLRADTRIAGFGTNLSAHTADKLYD